MYTDLMVDLETLGTAPGSVFTQIGLCAFSAEEIGGRMESRCIFVDVDSALRHGLRVNGGTIRYWLRENDEARAMMAAEGGSNLTNALLSLSSFVNAKFVEPYDGSYGTGVKTLRRVWGYGPSFDIALLDAAADMVEMKLPWEHGQVRCVRTLKELFPGAERPAPKIAHYGEDDAVAQALWVQNMWHKFKEMRDDGTSRTSQERD